MGHSRPDCAVRVMSGLAPIAAGERTCRFGSFVPRTVIETVAAYGPVCSKQRTLS